MYTTSTFITKGCEKEKNKQEKQNKTKNIPTNIKKPSLIQF